MPKMTTEQFLSQLGIEVGKPFMCDGKKETVISVHKDFQTMRIEWIDNDGNTRVDVNTVQWLINKEITPLPKYTLSEDEKAIVRNIAEEFDIIGVDKDGVMYARNDNGLPTWLPFPTLFNFIKLRDEVSLDELRKCL